MEQDLESFVEASGGVVSVSELGRYLQAPKSAVRELCSELSIRRIGSAFCIDIFGAQSIAGALGDEDDLNGDPDDDGDGDVDDEGDTEDDDDLDVDEEDDDDFEDGDQD